MPRLVSSRTLDELHWASMTLAAGAQSMLGGNGGFALYVSDEVTDDD